MPQAAIAAAVRLTRLDAPRHRVIAQAALLSVPQLALPRKTEVPRLDPALLRAPHLSTPTQGDAQTQFYPSGRRAALDRTRESSVRIDLISSPKLSQRSASSEVRRNANSTCSAQ
jgi:hypothetical protein